jgi:excinuclease ABC subunit A
MKNEYIVIKGARENNLKNIDLDIPRNQLVVMTGLSGSGKTSLAFDTIYAEGQRRYVESLSAYARQFLGNIDKPDVDSIEGLSPAVSIDQKTTSNNPRSTVGTVTEIYDYLRLMFARIGVAYCPTHNIPISAQSIEQMMETIYSQPEDSRVFIYSPVVTGQKGTHARLFEQVVKEGFVRGRVNGEEVEFSSTITLDKNKKHTIEVLIDRLKLSKDNRSRIFDSLEIALQKAQGLARVMVGESTFTFSEHFACPHCDFTISGLEPRLFSFNAPYGACTECKGIGTQSQISLELSIDFDKTILEGAFKPAGNIVDPKSIYAQQVETAMKHFKIDIKRPLKKFSDDELKLLLYGSKEPIEFHFASRSGYKHSKVAPFEGLINSIERRKEETTSNWTRRWLEEFSMESPCPACDGKRLNEKPLSVRVGALNIHEFTVLPIRQALDYVDHLTLSEKDMNIARLVLKEVKERLSFLIDVGLDYLTLDRRAGTLSGGEAQRIRLATQIGSRLSGVLYVLDEPSIGLHQRDNARLIKTLKSMRDLGNTLIVVEHDEETMMEADHLIDIGPAAGLFGGEVTAQGTPQSFIDHPTSITGKYLAGQLKIDVPKKRRKAKGYMTIVGAVENNLKNVTVKIPTGVYTVVTGVSGSGKSSLVNEVLYKALARKLYQRKELPGKHKELLGYEVFDKIVEVDQSPIGRTPRSNPATYTKVFDDIRDLFAVTTEAKLRGYQKGRFSFNVKGGRCESCAGDGLIKIEMNFLPDVYVPCEVCHGKRYNSETLEVKYKGKNIADVLSMTVSESVVFFENIPRIAERLKTIEEVGLGYVRLGQSATTLSGGEAQRVKLASELHKRITPQTVYILDEPTTGLHTDDVKRLIQVLQSIVDKGATVVVIEHNLDMIKVADWVIDLGPEGGDRGGEVIAEGTPEAVAKLKHSYTGQYLQRVLR